MDAPLHHTILPLTACLGRMCTLLQKAAVVLVNGSLTSCFSPRLLNWDAIEQHKLILDSAQNTISYCVQMFTGTLFQH